MENRKDTEKKNYNYGIGGEIRGNREKTWIRRDQGRFPKMGEEDLE